MSHDDFDTVVATHHGEIYRYLLLVTGRVPDANALSQETFLRAFTAKNSVEHAASVRPWLFTIATRLCWSRLRPISRGRRLSTSVADKDQEAAPREGKNAVAVAIARLPVRQRLAFALRKLHDFDYEGIERMLGCPKRSARGCVIRAFRNVSRMRSVKSALGSVTEPQARPMDRARGGEILITDGPFAETKEQLGGPSRMVPIGE